jgi:hypothetical protein
MFFIGSNGSNKAFRRSESSETSVESCISTLGGGSSGLPGGVLGASSGDTSKFLPLAVVNKLPFFLQLI